MSEPYNKGAGQGLQWLRDHVDYDKHYCLIWPFARVRGYGHVSVDGVLHYAHRYMCQIAHGEPPSSDHHAAHSCGRGDDGCVNPRHLSWKTQSENEIDKRRHGTSRAVTSEGLRYKLTAEQVAEIRAMRGTKTQAELAKMFGVSRRNIGMIQTGQSWPTGQRIPIGTSPSSIARHAKKAAADSQIPLPSAKQNTVSAG